jgi:hypothetical protein
MQVLQINLILKLAIKWIGPELNNSDLINFGMIEE